MRTVGYDLDGTLFSLDKTVEVFNREFNKNLKLEQIVEYDLEKFYDISFQKYLDTWFKNVEEIILTSQLNEKVMNDLVQEHAKGSEIIIVTARENRFDSLNKQVLDKLNVPYSRIYSGQRDKFEVLSNNNASKFLDDKGDLVENLLSTHLNDTCELSLVDAPYNQNYLAHTRFIL